MSLKITIVSDENSWINCYIKELIHELEMKKHSTEWIHNVKQIKSGDIVFYLSCWQKIEKNILELNKHNLVVHESDLPQGRGWSPLTWQILEGKSEIPICLFEAEENIDSGAIYIKKMMHFSGHELLDELRERQARTSFEMCLGFLNDYPAIKNNAEVQWGKPSYYRKRLPTDSQLDIDKTIKDQFNLLRTVDNEKYPAFFEINGHKYILKIYKV